MYHTFYWFFSSISGSKQASTRHRTALVSDVLMVGSKLLPLCESCYQMHFLLSMVHTQWKFSVGCSFGDGTNNIIYKIQGYPFAVWGWVRLWGHHLNFPLQSISFFSAPAMFFHSYEVYESSKWISVFYLLSGLVHCALTVVKVNMH